MQCRFCSYDALMRCLVLGHSGTAGFGLDSPTQSWPALFEHLLKDSVAQDWAVSSVALFPVGARAIEYAITRVEQVQPELVVLSLNAYPCVVPVVSASVRHRFGRWAERRYLALEGGLETRAGEGRGSWPAINKAGRRWGRRLLGTRTMASVAEVGSAYSEILRRLAHLEGIQVVVLAEALFGATVRLRVQNLEQRVRDLHGLVQPTADDHRFLWCDATEWLVPDDGDAFWHEDDVHLSIRGNARYAEMLMASLAARLP